MDVVKSYFNSALVYVGLVKEPVVPEFYKSKKDNQFANIEHYTERFTGVYVPKTIDEKYENVWDKIINLTYFVKFCAKIMCVNVYVYITFCIGNLTNKSDTKSEPQSDTKSDQQNRYEIRPQIWYKIRYTIGYKVRFTGCLDKVRQINNIFLLFMQM